MKKTIVFLAFLLIAATTHAQEQHLALRGMKIYSEGVPLKKSEAKSLMLGTPGYDLYGKALDQRSSGGVLLGLGITTAGIGFFSLMLTGLFHAMDESEGPRDSYWNNGGAGSLGAILAGAGMSAGGIVLLRAGKRNASPAVDAYNLSLDRPATGELSLGFTPGGVGLTYCF
jgi:hypothetical protein